jgi:hypothetical protein
MLLHQKIEILYFQEVLNQNHQNSTTIKTISANQTKPSILILIVVLGMYWQTGGCQESMVLNSYVSDSIDAALCSAKISYYAFK